MQIGMIEGATRTIGKSQGYHGLPLRDELINCTVNGGGTPCMITAWVPTSAEIEAIIAGAPVLLSVLGTVHPPVMIDVGEPPATETAEAVEPGYNPDANVTMPYPDANVTMHHPV